MTFLNKVLLHNLFAIEIHFIIRLWNFKKRSKVLTLEKSKIRDSYISKSWKMYCSCETTQNHDLKLLAKRKARYVLPRRFFCLIVCKHKTTLGLGCRVTRTSSFIDKNPWRSALPVCRHNQHLISFTRK